MELFEKFEEQDGVRFNWNVFPSTSRDAKDVVLPISCVYNPRHKATSVPVTNHPIAVCGNKDCGAILNPYCQIDLTTRTWTCRMCMTRNRLPVIPGEADPHALPAAADPQNTTIEYATSRTAPTAPAFLFVLDTNAEPEELESLKDSLTEVIDQLPEHCAIGLLSYGSSTQFYQLGYSHCLRSLAFNGEKSYSSKDIEEAFGYTSVDGAAGSRRQGITNQFLVPQTDSFVVIDALQQIKANKKTPKEGDRFARGTGTAINVALSFAETALSQGFVRIGVFTSGPATVGPGKIVDIPLKEPIRGHHDIINGTAIHHKAAAKYYGELGTRAAAGGFAVDLIVGSYDQVGVAEIGTLSHQTGGVIILSDSFTTSICKESIRRHYSFGDENVGMAHAGARAVVEVKTTPELKVQGMIGHGVSLDKRSKMFATDDRFIGIGQTCAWSLASISPKNNYVFYFVNTAETPTLPPSNQQVATGVIQIITHYLHPSGVFRVRVSTLARNFGPQHGLLPYFDQEAAATAVSRETAFRMQHGESADDTIRWLDTMLVKFCNKFGEFRKGDNQSFRLPPYCTMLPQFLFHLRRSQFVQTFNNSPDETAYYWHYLLAENVYSTIVMINPALLAFELDNIEGVPVLLDSISVTSERILLLDTFFHVIIFHGETVAAWRNAGYHEQAEYGNIADLLNAPKEEVRELLSDRFPLPRYINCDQGGSQARFLLAKLNPTTQSMDMAGAAPGTVVLTDDASLQTFMESLCKLAMNL